MCLYVKRGCKPEITQEDITCWKAVVEVEGSNVWAPVFYPGLEPYDKVLFAKVQGSVLADEHLFVHKCYCRLGYEKGPSEFEYVEEGFHAFRNLHGIINGVRDVLPESKGYKLHFCIIPKGAEYCKGTDGQIVANRMIVFSSFKEYLKYKFKK